MRLFLALDLPGDLRSALASVPSEIAGARWVAAENLHVTLHFLGDTAPETAAALAAEVQRLLFAPVPLVPEGLDVFPNLRRPNVLVVRLARNAAFEALYAELGGLIRRHGFTPEARPFRPHVTVARLKSPEPKTLQALLAQPISLPVATAHQLGLYESMLERGGVRYRPISTAHASPA